jgi:hypothetical protein
MPINEYFGKNWVLIGRTGNSISPIKKAFTTIDEDLFKAITLIFIDFLKLLLYFCIKF